MTSYIKRKYGYFEVFIDGKFYCTADNEREARQEVENYMEGCDVDEIESA